MKELSKDALVTNEQLTSTDESKHGEILVVDIKMHMKGDHLSHVLADSEI